MSKKRVVATSFTPTPDWLRTWVEDKDRTYWSPEKHARGIQSYSLALKSLEDYFKAIKIGSLKPNQRSIAYFAKVWGWNWTKTLRFFVAVMEALENLDSRFQYFKRKAQEYAEKAKQYVYKARGKEYRGKHTADTSKSDESELEEAFLDAMVALGSKSNPAFYREKVKQNLRAGDKATLENFEAWKAKRVAEAEERKKMEFKVRIEEYFRKYNQNHPHNQITKIHMTEQGNLEISFENGEIKTVDGHRLTEMEVKR